MPTEQEGQRVFLTTAVGDVVKSSALLQAQKERINGLIADCLAKLRETRKFVNVKHNGDGFTLFSQDPMAVAEAALHIRHQFRTHDWQSCGLEAQPTLRIGINAGIATIGKFDGVGHEATGEGIITAARIEPTVKPDEIWCSETVASALRSDARFGLGSPMEITLPKGAGACRVASLNWAHEHSTATKVSSPPPPAPPTVKAIHPEGDIGIPGVSHCKIPLRLGAHTPLDLVLVQLDAADMDSIVLDQTRPTAMLAIRSIFDSIDPLIDNYVSCPALIHFPELAFDISEWDAIDTRIRTRTSGPLILIAGFGPATGASLEQWKAASGPTQRTLCLAEGETLANMKTYNGGWCWVHDPRSEPTTRCYLFLKNFLEQRIEPYIVTEIGKSILALEFEDLLLLPGICADFICEAPNNPQERMRKAIEAHGQGKAVLMTASLLDKAPWNSFWTSRLDSMVQLGAKVVVSVCNWAIDLPCNDDGDDMWRSRTGVFTARGHKPVFDAKLPFVRKVETAALLGGVARRSVPSILFGQIKWPSYGPTTGLALWRGDYSYDMATKVCHGSPSFPPPSVEAYEFHRFLRRRLTCETPEDQSGLATLLALDDELLQRLLKAALNGPPSAEIASWGFDDDQTDPQDLLKWASQAICLLSGTGEFDWCGCADHDGQLNCGKTDANVMVWSGMDGPKMTQALREWTLRPSIHPPLIAVAHAEDGLLDEGPVRHNGHTDITLTAPSGNLAGPSRGEDFTEVRPPRYAKIIRTGWIVKKTTPLADRLSRLRDGVH